MTRQIQVGFHGYLTLSWLNKVHSESNIGLISFHFLPLILRLLFSSLVCFFISFLTLVVPILLALIIRIGLMIKVFPLRFFYVPAVSGVEVPVWKAVMFGRTKVS